MTSQPKLSTRNPTLKRILKEASELATQPSADYHAAPLESDLFEWHFTLRGPPAPSPFENGAYHGRIVLPPAYPLKPPSFRFLTPTGRFEANREICLSISGHHEETWQPAWGIRTALVALRSFMDTEAKGQLGGMEASTEVRKRWAAQSSGWSCKTCGRTNGEILAEQGELAKESEGAKDEGQKKADEVVPDELRLGYREDLGKGDAVAEGASEGKGKKVVDVVPEVPPGLAAAAEASIPPSTVPQIPAPPDAALSPSTEAQPLAAEATSASTSSAQPQAPQQIQIQQRQVAASAPAAALASAPATVQRRPQQPLQQRPHPAAVAARQAEAASPWIDKAILAVLGAIAFLIYQRFM